MLAIHRNSALVVGSISVLAVCLFLIQDSKSGVSDHELTPVNPVISGESGRSEIVMEGISTEANRNAESADASAALPAIQAKPTSLPARSEPNLRKELAGMKRRLRALTFGQFSEYWSSGAYKEYDRLTPAALSDDDGNPLPNEVRAGLNGGFRVAVLHPDTHPEACALMIGVRSLEAEIRAIESTY